jgi:hypothetical protein
MEASRIKRALYAVVAGALAALATSCGGGGGGAEVAPPAPVPTVAAVWDSAAATWDNVVWQ